MPPLPKFVASTASDPKYLKHKRRYCRIEGCARIVKSQGLCQRHGAKPRKCKVDGCEKQAQGNFDRMCKSHFKAMKRMTTPLPKVDNTEAPPPPHGCSVYDDVLPSSICYIPSLETVMPLIRHLKAGFDELKPSAWHRNEERRARGMFPVDNPATQLEGWERELVWMEILVLTGAPKASFRHLARAWGRDKGFHMVLAQFICERHGDVRRKRRQGEKEEDGEKKSGMKTRITGKNKLSSGMISADIWDDSCYGDADTNEALAADIFNFSAQEFENVSSKWKGAYKDLSSGSSLGAPSMASLPHTSLLVERGKEPAPVATTPSRNFSHPLEMAGAVASQYLLRYQQQAIPNLTAQSIQEYPEIQHARSGQQYRQQQIQDIVEQQSSSGGDMQSAPVKPSDTGHGDAIAAMSQPSTFQQVSQIASLERPEDPSA
ncbi:unnamed protein product [Cylindrotheca closterium]|uniref:Uncharacterized protein n=1 Tax=Cylindrotheca closterium TaxID=2856 RepID=A0AAD2CRM4_9STRA|nr:unnamed protein product [Cylindrotheca closterium]